MAKKQFISPRQNNVPPKRILGAALSLLIFILLLLSVIRLGEKYFAVRARNKELATEAAALQQKGTDLVATNAYLLSPQGTEASIRESYNYVKPGEGMIVVTPQTALSEPVAPPQSILMRLWGGLLRIIGIRKDTPQA